MKSIKIMTLNMLLAIGAVTVLALPLIAETPQERCRAAMHQETRNPEPSPMEYQAEIGAARKAYNLCRSASISADLRAQSARRWAMLEQRDHAEAEAIYRRAIRDITKTDGLDSPALLPLLYGLMDLTCYVSGGPNAETFTIAHEVRRIAEKAYGSKSEPAAKALLALGRYHEINGSRLIAETFYREAVAAAEAACASKCDTLAQAYAMLRSLIKEDPARQAEAEDLDNRAFEAIPD